MTFQRTRKLASSHLPTQMKISPLARRSFASQALLNSSEPPTREQGEVEVSGVTQPVALGHNFANIPVHRPEDSRRGVMAQPDLVEPVHRNRSQVKKPAQMTAAQEATNGTGLPDRLKAGVEYLSGLSVDDVTVHRNSSEPSAFHAHAYTSGTDIHIAPGQEQHVAHEAWHVVQQKQGRVKPMDRRTQGASINDDSVLEREADQMGAQALQSNFLKQIPQDTPLPVTGSLQPKIIQAKKVPTDFGEFETTNFAEANGRGVAITLKFDPAEQKVDAKKIALSQSVKATKENGAAYAVDPNRANRMVASGKSGAGYLIDAPGSTNNPIYFDTKNFGAAQDLKDTPESGNTTTDPIQLGVNTVYQLGCCYKEKETDAAKTKRPAAMIDRPYGRKKKGAGMMFETAAFAIEGTDKNKYYGSVKWGYKMEGTDAAPTVTKMDIERASKGRPTTNFIQAAKLWNLGKTQGTLKVIADPATVYKMDLRTTETLAKDTKVKQLDTAAGGTEAMIKVEVLNPDGTGSGKLVYINVPDVKDMGDGSANKKLPT